MLAKRPIILSPMANAGSTALAVAVAQAGGVGSLPAAAWNLEELRESIITFRGGCSVDPVVNFFAHQSPHRSSAEDLRWLEALAPLYEAEGIPMHARDSTNFHHDLPSTSRGSLPHWFRRKVGRQPFDSASLKIIEELKLKCVSFHFGLPQWPDTTPKQVVERIRQASPGIHILSTATTLDEALWLAQNGVDGVIAQGIEAGGHRGTFLDPLARQPSLKELVDSITRSPEFRRYSVPLIAAGGVCTRNDVQQLLGTGAAAVQVGTRFLNAQESSISEGFRKKLTAPESNDYETTLTRCFTGRIARALVNRATRHCAANVRDADIPAFPSAVDGWSHLRYRAEARGCWDYTPMLCGERVSASVGEPEKAADILRLLSPQTLHC